MSGVSGEERMGGTHVWGVRGRKDGLTHVWGVRGREDGWYIYVWGVCGSVEALEEERVGGHMSRGVGRCQGKNRWVDTCLGEWGGVRGRTGGWTHV